MLKRTLAFMFILALLISTLSVPGLAAPLDDTTVDVDAVDVDDPVVISADLEITLGVVYQLVALIATEHIPPANYKALKGIDVDVDNPDNLLVYAKTIGLLTDLDMAQYKFRFNKAFDLSAPATRQEYAVIIDRLFIVLRYNGVQFAVPKPSSSSPSLAWGSGNGTGTTRNIGGGNNGEHLTIDYFRDYQNLSGYAQKAFSSALMLGFLNVKKYDDAKTVKLLVSSEFANARSMFLAPNDIITFGELSSGLTIFQSLKLTTFSFDNLRILARK